MELMGTYYVTLRLFNSVGCYEEFVKIVNVGKGYNILDPNVFHQQWKIPKI